MINIRKDNDKITIYGDNKTGRAPLVIIPFVSYFAILLVWGLTGNLLHGLLCALIVICTLPIFIRVIKFSIELTPNTLTVKKTFLGVHYLTIERRFDKVLYNDKIDLLSFQNQMGKIDIESLEGFEGDYLLVTIDNKSYEFGDKKDAEIIFTHLLDGLDQLKISKTLSDIGLAKINIRSSTLLFL